METGWREDGERMDNGERMKIGCKMMERGWRKVGKRVERGWSEDRKRM